uniref:Uncharacterized protein n=1 Tax=Oryza nivara TaxID=4536 RepID=A0A0E0FLM3_ORYNI
MPPPSSPLSFARADDAVVQSKLSNGNRSAGTPLHRLLRFYFYQMHMEKNKLLSSPYAYDVLQEAFLRLP